MQQGLHIRPKQQLKNLLLKVGIGISILAIVVLGTFLYINFFNSENAEAATSVNIQGRINSYAKVTGISGNSLTINNLDGIIGDFSAGRKLMVIQMKGANMTTTNDINYGNITNLNQSGLHEFIRVQNITGLGPYTVTLDGNLINNYNAPATDFIQVVSVPQYENAVVTATLTSSDWNSTTGTGGILAFEASGSLTLNANLDVSGRGFRGAIKGGSDGGNNNSGTFRTNNSGFALKGEGIVNITTDLRHAKGKMANGGGGGNPHNAGGGGGGNNTRAGNGGNGWTGAGGDNSAAGGIGGATIDYITNNNRIFFGGGGGAGQQNDNLAGNGGNGGGIIIFRASQVLSNGAIAINANGQNGQNPIGNDGAGGGGGGGAIKIDVVTWNNTSPISLNVNGGDGGNVTVSIVHGGGGGGGIGIVQLTTNPNNSNLIYSGVPGINGNDCSSCSTSGTQPAVPNAGQQLITGVVFPGQMTSLPISLINFEAKNKDNEVILLWTTASEINNDFFTIEKTTNGLNYELVGNINGAGNSDVVNKYSISDKNPISGSCYYRLKQTDFDGNFKYFPLILVDHKSIKDGINLVKIWPNPFVEQFSVHYTSMNNDPVELQILNSKGQQVYLERFSNKKGENRISFTDGAALNADVYIVRIMQRGTILNTSKVIKK